MPRVYFQNASEPDAPSVLRGNWNQAPTPYRVCALGASKSGSLVSDGTVQPTTLTGEWFLIRGCLGPLAAGTYTITSIALPVGGGSIFGAPNYFRTHAHAFIESGGGTLRGTLLDNYLHGTNLNARSTAGQVIDVSSVAVAVEASEGDYLYIEGGVTHLVAGNHYCSRAIGGTGADQSAGSNIGSTVGYIDYTFEAAAPVPGAPTIAQEWDTDHRVTITATPGAGDTDGYKFYRAGTLVATQASPVYQIPVEHAGSVNWTCKAYNEYGDSLESNTLAVAAVVPSITMDGPDQTVTIAATADFALTPTGHVAAYRWYIDGVLDPTHTGTTMSFDAPYEATVTAIAYNGYGDSVEREQSFDVMLQTGTFPLLWYGAPNGQVGHLTSPDGPYVTELTQDASIPEGGYLFDSPLDSLWSPSSGTRMCQSAAGTVFADNNDVAEYLYSWLAFDKEEPFSVEGEALFQGSLTGTFIEALLVPYSEEGLYSHEVAASTTPEDRLMYDKRAGYPNRNEVTSGVAPDFATAWLGKWVKFGFSYTPGAPSVANPSRTTSWVEIDGVRTDICMVGDYRSKWSEDLNFAHPVLSIQRYSSKAGLSLLGLRNFRVTEGLLACASFSAHGHFPFVVRGNGSYAWMNNSDSTIYSIDNIRASHAADSASAIYLASGTNGVLTTVPIDVPTERSLRRMHVKAKNVHWEVLDELGTTLIDGTTSASAEELVSVDLRPYASTRRFSTRLTLLDTTSMLRWWDVSWATPITVSSGVGDAPAPRAVQQSAQAAVGDGTGDASAATPAQIAAAAPSADATGEASDPIAAALSVDAPSGDASGDASGGAPGAGAVQAGIADATGDAPAPAARQDGVSAGVGDASGDAGSATAHQPEVVASTADASGDAPAPYAPGLPGAVGDGTGDSPAPVAGQSRVEADVADGTGAAGTGAAGQTSARASAGAAVGDAPAPEVDLGEPVPPFSLTLSAPDGYSLRVRSSDDDEITLEISGR